MRKINVAICGPYSGERSKYGYMLIKESAVLQDIVSLAYFDDRAEPKYAFEIANQISNYNFDLVLGHFNSYCALAVQPLYEKLGISFVAPLSTNPLLKFSKGGVIFTPSDDSQLLLIQQESFLSKKEIIIFTDNSTYGNHLGFLLKNLSPYSKVVNTVNEIKSLTFEQKNTLIFLSGKHCNLIKFHLELRKLHPNLMIIACDDCYIDEYLFTVKPIINSNDFVIGCKDGHLKSLLDSLDYVKLLALSNLRKRNLYNFIGKDFEHFKFDKNGRYIDKKFNILPISTC